jgi:tetratricopeptide (TPR) repeat protein
MNKENILFAIVGLLVGLIVGFTFANSVNQNQAVAVAPGSAVMAPGGVAGQNPNAGHMENAPEIQAAINLAKNEPDNFEAQLKAAEYYYQIQRFDGAIELLKRANELKPDDYSVLVHLGNAYFDSKNYEEAEKWYTTALSKNEKDVNVRTDLGLTFMFRQTPDYDRAIKEFKSSLEVDPNHKQTLQNLTVAYTKKGDAENANSTLAKLEGVDSTNTSLPTLREDIQKISAVN